MANRIGKTIERYRKSLGKTQDQLGTMYSVTGPAIFKFEKGYVKPSLELWMRVAYDAGLTPRNALMCWIKDKLPEQFLEILESIEEGPEKSESSASQAYAGQSGRDELRKAVLCDPTLPGGVIELVRDDEFWSLYKPTGAEIDHLLRMYGGFDEGTPDMYREALRLIRQFLELSTASV